MDSGNDYLVQAKGNQKKLKTGLLRHCEANEPEMYKTEEKNRDRVEIRETRLYRNVKGKEFESWPGLNDVIVVRRKGIRDSGPYDDLHYYISSRSKLSAKEYSEQIRRHWHIENKLHWVKDVIMYEDSCRIKDKRNAANQSLIRNIVLNVYRMNGYNSLKKAFEKFANRIEDCLNILNNNKYIFIRSE